MNIDPKDVACRSAIDAASQLLMFEDARSDSALMDAMLEYVTQVRKFWEKARGRAVAQRAIDRWRKSETKPISRKAKKQVKSKHS